MSDTLTTTTTVSTVPSGTIIATDDLGAAGHVQRVKLACGPDGTATDVPVGGGVEAAALRVTIASDSTGVLSIDDNGGAITVDGSVSLAAALPAGTNNIGDVDVLSLPALAAGTNAIGKLAANSGVDIGDVDVLSLPTLANVTTVATVSALTGGGVAHDGADSGNPVKVGGQARTTNPTAVADADRVNFTADDLGRQVVVLSQVRDLVTHQHTQIASSSSETTIGTAVASTFLDLTSLVLTNQTATAVNCTIKDATAGTTRMIIALPASGGAVLNFPVPVPQASVNNNWTCTLSSAAVTVNVFAQFVKNI